MQGKRIGNLFFLRKLRDFTFGELYKVATIDSHRISSFSLGYLIDKDISIKTKQLQEKINNLKTHKIKGIAIEEIKEIRKRKLLLTPYIHGFPLDEVAEKAKEKNNPFNLEISLSIIRNIIDEVILLKESFSSHGTEKPVIVLPDQIFITYDGIVMILFPSLSLTEDVLKSGKQFELISKAMFGYLFPKNFTGKLDNEIEIKYYTKLLLLTLTTSNEIGDIDSLDENSIKSKFRLPVPFNESTEIPDFLVKIIEKGLNNKYSSLKQLFNDIEDIFERGDVQPTTYTLAFFINSLLRDKIHNGKEQHQKDFLIEIPEEEKETEEKTDKLYKEIEKEVEHEMEKEKSSLPLIIGITSIVIVAILGLLLLKGNKEKTSINETQKIQTQQPVKQEQKIDIEKLKQEIERSLSQKYEEKIKEIESKYEEQMRKINEEAKRKQLELEKERMLQQLKAQQEKEKQKQIEEIKKIAENVEAETQKIPENKEKPKNDQIKKIQEETGKTIENKTESTKKIKNEEVKKEPEVKKGGVYPIVELDKPIKLKSRLKGINVPPSIRSKVSKLRVIATVLVNEDGKPEKINIISIIPNYPGIKKKIEALLKKAEFTKPTKKGVPVKTWKSLNFVIKTGR